MVTQIENYDQVDVFVGLDVGKGEHHAVALDRTGKKLCDRPLPNDEHRLRAVLAELQRHGIALLIVDQPATSGYDDLAAQITQVGNRVRGLLTQIHTALERVVGPRLDHPAILDLLQRYPSPAAMRAAGEKRIATRMLKLAPRKGRDRAREVIAALGEQTVVVTGTNAAALVLPRLAAQLASLRKQRDEVAAEVERLVDAHRLQPVLTSMPGVGVRTAARLLTEVAGKHFPTARHLAACAGLAPVTRRSGSSIRGKYSSRRGNKILKNAMFLSAFAALRDPDSRAYYDRKTAQGKRHNQALLALARRRSDVLYAMLRDGTLYQSPRAEAA